MGAVRALRRRSPVHGRGIGPQSGRMGHAPAVWVQVKERRDVSCGARVTLWAGSTASASGTT